MSWFDVFHVEVDVSVLLQFSMPVIGKCDLSFKTYIKEV
jgi:hypothetical protein